MFIDDKRSLFEGLAKLRLGEIGRGFAQNLVGLTKLAVLRVERLHLLDYIARQTGPFAAIDLGLLNPLVELVAGEQPSLAAMDETAAHREEWSAS